MSLAKRKRLIVDPKLQRAFLLRAVFYWLACILCLAMTIMTVVGLPKAGDSLGSFVGHQWFRFLPAFVIALALLPAMAYDMVRLTNRFVGPLVRLRSAMQGAAQGDRMPPLHLREGDFWRECADEFNTILSRLQEAEAARHVAASNSAASRSAVEKEPAEAVKG